PQVSADGPAPFLQPLYEARDAGQAFWIVRGKADQHADAPHPLALGLHAKRPKHRRHRSGGASNLHEITPSHCRPRSKTTPFDINSHHQNRKLATAKRGPTPNVHCRIQSSACLSWVTTGKARIEQNESAQDPNSRHWSGDRFPPLRA